MALGDLCTFNYGKSLPAGSRSGAGYAVYGSNGEVGRHETPLTTGSTIIVGRKGSFGEVHFSDEPCWPIDTTYFIDASSTIADLRWLMYRLRSLGLTELNRAAAIPGLNREDAYRQRLLVPPVEEQRRFAAVLDKADDVRAKRQTSLALLDTLNDSIFLDIASCEPWPMVAVEDVAGCHKHAIRTGPFGSQLLHSEFVDDGIPVLGIDNAVQDRFVWGRPRFITPEKFKQLRRYQVHPGDVLVTIMGTCGRCAVVPDDIPVAINTKHLCCITLDQERCLPEFLWACFKYHPEVRRQLGATARGAVMPGLNMGLIKSARLPLPPLRVQQDFMARSRAVSRCEQLLHRARSSVDELFASLQQRAFAGQL
jgi:type I restriction enzyme, S subunit